jgi:hypothetical protein
MLTMRVGHADSTVDDSPTELRCKQHGPNLIKFSLRQCIY